MQIKNINFKYIGSVSLLVLILDHITKAIVVSKFQLGDELVIIPGLFNLTLTYNKGAAFGFLSNLPDLTRNLALAFTTLVALGAVTYFLFKDYAEDKVGQFALAMIFGGAIGNVIDRFIRPGVVDFLDFYYEQYHWPAFNVADSAICIAVFILILRQPKTMA